MTEFDTEIFKQYSTLIMTKKVILFAFILLSLLLASRAAAQQKAFQNPGVDQENSINGVKPQIYPVPPYRDNPTQILGQDHAYSVTFRGNGEAVVSTKVVLTNLSDIALENISLRIPRVDPKDIIVFQVLRERQCMRYRPMPLNEPQTMELREKYCAEFQDPDYYGYYGNAKYQKAVSLFAGDTLDITLPQSVKVNGSGAFLVYYRAFGYAKKNLFGAYTFSFETLKVEDKIRNLTVGISTDSDLVLKGAKGKVNYRFNEAGMMAMKSTDSRVAMASPQFDQYYQQIGNGTITKNASNLQPLDSYTVKGAYAENSLLLYGKEVSIGLIVFLLCVALFIFIVQKTFSWLSVTKKPGTVANTMSMSVLTTTGLGFVTSLFILFYTIGLIMVTMFLRVLFGYDQLLFIVNILLVMISIAIYALLLFVPSIVVGVKKGVSWGLGTFVATVVWLIIDMTFAFIILFFAFRFQNRPYPIPYLENMMGGGMMRANIEKSSEGVPMMRQIEESSEALQPLSQ